MKFDAYWATFWGDRGMLERYPEDNLFQAVMNRLAEDFGAEIRTARNGLPGGYSRVYELVQDGEMICYLLTGGSGSASGSHQIRVQGAWSVDIADWVRRMVPDHTISRVDVAEDYCQDGLFDKLVRRAEKIARAHGVGLERVGAGWYEHQREKGRTLYVGSRKSAVFLRIYERGKKLLGEGQQADPNYIRVEVEIKPKSAAKGLVVQMPPEAFFGCSKWTSELYTFLCCDELERVKVGTVWRPSDQERVVNHLGRQFWHSLEKLRDSLGSERAVFEAIEKAHANIVHTREVLKTVKEVSIT